MKSRSSLLLAVFFIFSISVSGQPGNDIEARVDANSGRYTLSSASLKLSISGSVGQALSNVKEARGEDAIGRYRALQFSWKKNETSYVGGIRWYQSSPVILFDLTLPGGISGQSPEIFPVFDKLPDLPHRFSYHNRIFPLAQFFLEETSTPWMLFNDKADAILFSPASDFIVSLMSKNEDSTVLRSGLNPEVKDLPKGFTHSTIMVMNKGIRDTWDAWGTALRAIYNRKRPANDCDAILKYFGYWTDNGADYYYNYDSSKGYAGTLLAVRDQYRKKGIPIGYMQLDSWWYEKTRYNIEGKLGADIKKPEFPAGLWNRSGGLWQYKADKSLFPKGLAGFQKQLGLPLITHNRWIDSTSPYQNKYKISGYAAIDPAYWNNIMKYLKSSGVINYEQDWMNYMYTRNPEMIADVSIGNAFTDEMAKAALKNGINLQYCMALPRYFMQGVKYNNLTTIRASGDGFKPERWKYFIFTSQLAYEMGIWPWSDVFKSGEMGNMIVSVLSAGPVGTGDALGKENKEAILKACRADGVLVKPDLPILPMDQDYPQMARNENKPVLAYTYTQHGDIRTAYVLAFAEETTEVKQFSFQPRDIGLYRNTIVFNPVTKAYTVMKAGETFTDKLPADKYVYFIVAPVSTSGIAFLGDEGKITATGKQRISSIEFMKDGLQTVVSFAKGESTITLRGYSEKNIIADRGEISYDPQSHLFTLALAAPKNGESQAVLFTVK